MILVDTSTWIDFFAARDLPHTRVLERFIEADDDLALCGLILTEVLQGIRSDRDYKRTRAQLRSLPLLPMEESIFVKGAEIYRTMRKRGVTIRRTNDCLIAAVALSFDVPLLHADIDFDRIGRVFPFATAAGQGGT